MANLAKKSANKWVREKAARYTPFAFCLLQKKGRNWHFKVRSIVKMKKEKDHLKMKKKMLGKMRKKYLHKLETQSWHISRNSVKFPSFISHCTALELFYMRHITTIIIIFLNIIWGYQFKIKSTPYVIERTHFCWDNLHLIFIYQRFPDSTYQIYKINIHQK